MIVVEKNKNEKKYKMLEMPNFKNRMRCISWLRIQRKNATLLNVKSVSVQIKDIKMMKYTNEPRFLSLYLKMRRNNALSDEDAYIRIYKTSSLNKSLMYSLINADWIVNFDELEVKDNDELSLECTKLGDEILRLEKLENDVNRVVVENRIKLLRYKLNSINEYLVNSKTKSK